MNIIKKIQEEKERQAKEIKQLQQENDTDYKKLEELKVNYLYSSDVNEIDIMNAQIRDLTENINLRKEKINFLQNNDPRIDNLYVEQVKVWINERVLIDKESEELYKG